MIEVFPVDGGFRWHMIGADGRVLYYGDQTVYPSDVAASIAASEYRTNMWARAQCCERFPGSF